MKKIFCERICTDASHAGVKEFEMNIQDKMRGSSAIQLPRGIARFIII